MWGDEDGGPAGAVLLGQVPETGELAAQAGAGNGMKAAIELLTRTGNWGPSLGPRWEHICPEAGDEMDYENEFYGIWHDANWDRGWVVAQGYDEKVRGVKFCPYCGLELPVPAEVTV